jgi:hypothetical protein
MEDNKTLILREFEKLKGQFVITASWEIERLVAVGVDIHDYYWITYNGRTFTWNTCVGRIMPLKGHLQDRDYDELVRLARLNHYDQATLWGKPQEEGILLAEKHRTSLAANLNSESEEELLTLIHWDLKNTKE